MTDDATLALGLLSQVSLLAAAIVLGQWLHRRKVEWFGEAAGAICLGIAMGGLLRLYGVGPHFKDIMAFKGSFFLLVLLPPIMFDAAFTLDVKLFINNIGAICTFAFAGTTISMLCIGGHMWLAGWLGWCHRLSPMKAMLFGAMISATDPVTVLAVFKSLGAQQDLNMVVFGESVLNDAVGMVLFQTVQALLASPAPFTTLTLLQGCAVFVAIFLGSTLVGVAFGAAVSAVTRSGFFSHPPLEAAFVVVAAYLSYLAAQACCLSGIVAILFAGIVMARYTRPNLTTEAAGAVEAFSKVAASMAELFVFTYMGTLLLLSPGHWAHWRFMAMAVLSLAHSRAANIWPLSAAVNYLRPPQRRISGGAQLMLWWSGLRGGMAFSLAVAASQQYGVDGQAMMAACFMVCCLTVGVNGGSSAWMLRRLGLLEGRGGKEYQPLDKGPNGPHAYDKDPLATLPILDASTPPPRSPPPRWSASGPPTQASWRAPWPGLTPPCWPPPSLGAAPAWQGAAQAEGGRPLQQQQAGCSAA